MKFIITIAIDDSIVAQVKKEYAKRSIDGQNPSDEWLQNFFSNEAQGHYSRNYDDGFLGDTVGSYMSMDEVPMAMYKGGSWSHI